MENEQENDARSSGSLLNGLGAELVSIVAPVSACMLFVVLLVRALIVDTGAIQAPAIALIVYAENPSDSTSEKIGGAFLNALVFVAFVTAATFLLVGLFYLRCTKCLRFYVSFSIFNVLVYLGAGLGVLIVETYSIPVDAVTFSVLIFNFGVVGVLVAFPVVPVPVIFTQGYLVLIGMLTAFWFTFLPEWTTWFLLVAMALYDIAAVLLPGGPLNLLLELASNREEELPALVYESRPVLRPGQQLRRWRRRRVTAASPRSAEITARSSVARMLRRSSSDPYQILRVEAAAAADPPRQQRVEIETSEAPEEQRQLRPEETEVANGVVNPEQAAPGNRDEHVPFLMVEHSAFGLAGNERRVAEEMHEDLVELSEAGREGDGGVTRIESVTEGGIKLGLGDFIFYSVLVGRAAMFDLMTVWSCYLAIVAGLGATLVLLAVWRRALPALPVSISLGVLFYFLTRLVLEPFVLQLDTHLVFF